MNQGDKPEIGSVVYARVRFSDATPAKRLLYLFRQENDGYIGMNITSAKQEKLTRQRQTFSYVPVKANDSGLNADSFIKTDELFLINDKNIIHAYGEQITVPDAIRKLVEKRYQAIEKEAGDTFERYDCRQIYDKQIAFDELRRELEDVSRKFQEDPAVIIDYLKFSSQFYQYSARNQRLIYSKNPNATFVATYLNWQKLGYDVKKNPTAIRIVGRKVKEFLLRNGELVPIQKATTEEKKKVISRQAEVMKKTEYYPMYVYDISDTSCPKSHYPRLYDKGYACFDHQQMYQLLEHCAMRDGFDVIVGNLHSIALEGVCYPSSREIKLSDLLEDSRKAPVLAHEYAHGIMHSHHKNAREKLPEHIVEFEAEAFAFMMNERFHLPEDLSINRYLSNQYHRLVADQTYDIDKSFERLRLADRHLRGRMEEAMNENPTMLEKYQNRNQAPGEETVEDPPSQTNSFWDKYMDKEK